MITRSKALKETLNKNRTKIMAGLKNPLVIFVTIVCSTVLAHWILVQWYAFYCAPSGWTGPFKTLLTLGSPMCHFANMAQVELAKHYITIWVGAATAMITWVASTLKG